MKELKQERSAKRKAFDSTITLALDGNGVEYTDEDIEMYFEVFIRCETFYLKREEVE